MGENEEKRNHSSWFPDSSVACLVRGEWIMLGRPESDCGFVQGHCGPDRVAVCLGLAGGCSHPLLIFVRASRQGEVFLRSDSTFSFVFCSIMLLNFYF